MTPQEKHDAAIAHRGEDYLRVLEMAARDEVFATVHRPYRQTGTWTVARLIGSDWLAFDDLQNWGYLAEDVWPGLMVPEDDDLLALHLIGLSPEGHDFLDALRQDRHRITPL